MTSRYPLAWVLEICDPDAGYELVQEITISRAAATVILREADADRPWLQLHRAPTRDPAQKHVDDHPAAFHEIGACPACGCSHSMGSWSCCPRHQVRWRTKSPVNRSCAPIIEPYREVRGVYPTAESVEQYAVFRSIMDGTPATANGV